MKNLEEKISKAVEMGIKFQLVPAGRGATTVAFDTISVIECWSDNDFEKALDRKMEEFNNRTFLRILKDKNLLPSNS